MSSQSQHEQGEHAPLPGRPTQTPVQPPPISPPPTPSPPQPIPVMGPTYAELTRTPPQHEGPSERRYEAQRPVATPPPNPIVDWENTLPIPEIGIGETLGRTKLPTLDLAGKTSELIIGKQATETQKAVTETVGLPHRAENLGSFGGVIARGEALTYSLGQMFGFKTPRIPSFTMEYGPEYMVGSLIGEAFVSYGLGKALSPFTSPITERIAGKASEWLTSKAIERGPLESASLGERIVSGITGAKPYLAPQIVSVPTPEAVSLASLQAEQAGWRIAESSRSSAVLFSEMPSEKLGASWVKEHLFKTVSGGLAYSSVQEQLERAANPKLPFSPKELSDSNKDLGLLIPNIRVPLKPSQPKAMPFIPKIEPLYKQSEKQVPAMVLGLHELTVPGLSQSEMQIPVQKTKVIQIQQPIQVGRFMPQRTILGSDYGRRGSFLDLPRYKKRRGGSFLDFGQVFRGWPVRQPKQLLKTNFGMGGMGRKGNVVLPVNLWGSNRQTRNNHARKRNARR